MQRKILNQNWRMRKDSKRKKQPSQLRDRQPFAHPPGTDPTPFTSQNGRRSFPVRDRPPLTGANATPLSALRLHYPAPSECRYIRAKMKRESSGLSSPHARQHHRPDRPPTHLPKIISLQKGEIGAAGVHEIGIQEIQRYAEAVKKIIGLDAIRDKTIFITNIGLRIPSLSSHATSQSPKPFKRGSYFRYGDRDHTRE